MTGIALAGATVAAGAISAGVGAASSGQASAAQKAASEAQLRLQLMMYNEAKQRMNPWLAQGQKGLKGQRKMTDQYAADLAKWTDPEQYQKYLEVIQGAMGPYTEEEYRNSPLYTPMVRNLAELQATPGYQFQLEQGLQGINQQAAARGGLLSGAQLKAANSFAQNQAATGFQAAWERAQQAYQNAFANRQAQGAMAMQGLGAQQGLNQQAAGLTAQGANLYGNLSNQGLSAAQSLNQMGQSTAAGGSSAIGNYGAAQAAGYYGTGQAINQGINSAIGGGLLAYYGLNRPSGSGMASVG